MAGAARRGGAFFNQAAGAMTQLGHDAAGAVRDAGDVFVKYMDHQEISRGAAAGAQLINQKDQDWNETAKAADPNDPTHAAKWREENLEPALEQFKQGFTTERSQQWAEHFVDQYRTHMFQKTTADMSSLAADAVHVNTLKTINSLGNTLSNDPSSLGFARATLKSSLDGLVDSSPNLTAAQAAKVRTDLMFKGEEHLVRAAVMGAISKGGDWKRIAEDPKNSPFINAQEMRQFEQAERGQQRIEQGAQREARLMQEHTAKAEFHDYANKLEIDTIPKNVGETPTLPSDYWDRVKKAAQMPGASLEPGRLNAMVRQGEIITDRLNKPEPLGRVSHDTTMDLLRRMRATDESRLTSDEEIYKKFGDNELTRTDFNFLRNEFASMKTPAGEALSKDRGEFFKRYAPAIDAGMNGSQHTALGAQRMYEFEMDARRQEDTLRKKGLDPHLAYDPRSEYFLGRPEVINKNRASLADISNHDAEALKADKARAANRNVTGADRKVTGTEIVDIPAGMTPAQAIQWAKGAGYKSGQRVRLPDGQTGTVP